MEEFFDIVDENGEPTGETIERTRAHAEGIWHRTAHLWLLRKCGGEIQVLLQKRCENKDSFPGCYDISSAGHIPAGADYVASALRELKEELGITASAGQLIYCGSRRIEWDDVFHGKEYHDRQHTRVYGMWCDKDEADFTLQPEEVESVMWIETGRCIKAVRENTFKHCIELEELMMVIEGMQCN